MTKFHKDGSLPLRNTIFVFGSNLAGIHGAGAANQALKYGAKWGKGIGVNGLTYAIPTKDFDIQTLPIENIIPYIERFKKVTLEFPTIQFFVTRIGCGLAGFKDWEIATLFIGCGDNCSFAEQWKPYIK